MARDTDMAQMSRGMGAPSDDPRNTGAARRAQARARRDRMANAAERFQNARPRRGIRRPTPSRGRPMRPQDPVAGGMPDFAGSPGGPSQGIGRSTVIPDRGPSTVRPATPRPMPTPNKAMSNQPPSMGGTAGQAAPSQPLGAPVGVGGQPVSMTPGAAPGFNQQGGPSLGQGRPMMNQQIPQNANGRTINTTGPGLLQRDYRPF